MKVFPVGQMVSMGYKDSPRRRSRPTTPFPDESYKAAAKSFPALIPITPDNPAVPDMLRAWESLDRFDKPLLCAFSDMDPFNKGRQQGARSASRRAGTRRTRRSPAADTSCRTAAPSSPTS